MSQFSSIILKIDRFLHKILLVIAQVSLIGMTTLICVTVFCRFVLNSGIIWAEEVPRTLVAMFAFLACAMGVRDDFHISLGIVYNRFPKGGKGRLVFDWIRHIFTFLFGLILLIYGSNLVSQLGRFTMPATKWPRSVQYISLPIAGIMIMLDSLLHMFRLIGPDDLLYSEREEEYVVKHSKDMRKQEKAGDK